MALFYHTDRYSLSRSTQHIASHRVSRPRNIGEEQRHLGASRTAAFLNEPWEEGNRSVALAHQTSSASTAELAHKARVSKELDSIMRQLQLVFNCSSSARHFTRIHSDSLYLFLPLGSEAPPVFESILYK